MKKSEEVKRYTAHFGAIVFNYAMVAFVITLLVALSIVIFPMLVALLAMVAILYYGFLIISTIFTLGLLLLNEEYRGLYNTEFIEWVGDVGNNMNEIIPKMIDCIPYLAIITIALSIISFACLIVDKNWRPAKSRIVTLITVSIITIAVLLLAALGVLAIIGGIAQ